MAILNYDFNAGVNAAKDYILAQAMAAFKMREDERAKDLRDLSDELTAIMKFPFAQEEFQPDASTLDIKPGPDTITIGPECFGGEDYPSDAISDCDIPF